MTDDKSVAILAIDQGTTSSRAIVFGQRGETIASAQMEFPQIYPSDGWVEHDPEIIWSTTLKVTKQALLSATEKGVDVVAIGVSNQRETVVVWDRETGKPIYNAIVWQDRRTADVTGKLADDGCEAEVTERTGLLLDPYFSATKIAWILDNVGDARARAVSGKLACGTIDTFLIWCLTNGAVHATDATNASRTSLFNIRTQDWDEELLRLFNVPRAILPEVKDSADDFGVASADLLGRVIPISGVAGDQQAAAIGQACFSPGSVKSTYGTGCFLIMNTGNEIVRSENRLLSTIAYRLNNKATYALEGSIFIAGAAVQWLRDDLGILETAAESALRAERASPHERVVMVPAFTGMGAPQWAPNARAAVFGMTRRTGPDEMARAALEGVAYQTHDLLKAMARDGFSPQILRVDGGMVANRWFVQRLSDILNLPIDLPAGLETTALGASYLAGLKFGLYASLDDIAANWVCERSVAPNLETSDRERLLCHWQKCVDAVLMTQHSG